MNVEACSCGFRYHPSTAQRSYLELELDRTSASRCPLGACATDPRICGQPHVDEMTVIVPPELLPDGAKGLVFDCDGTLMDTMSQHWMSWRLACAKFGLPMTVQQFIGCVMTNAIL
jgi:hypothetical protein